MAPNLIFLLVLMSTLVLVLGALAFTVTSFYVRVPSGQALVVSTATGPPVTFTGALVLPVIQRGELVDLTAQVIRIERSGRDGLSAGAASGSTWSRSSGSA